MGQIVRKLKKAPEITDFGDFEFPPASAGLDPAAGI